MSEAFRTFGSVVTGKPDPPHRVRDVTARRRQINHLPHWSERMQGITGAPMTGQGQVRKSNEAQAIIDRSRKLFDRISGLRNQLYGIHETLFGPEPSPENDQPERPAPTGVFPMLDSVLRECEHDLEGAQRLAEWISERVSS